MHGTKAGNLSLLKRADVRVPHGFVLGLENKSEEDIQVEAKAIWEELRGQYNESSLVERPLILRSSALVEDRMHARFPGRFASYRDLSSLEVLLAGIDECREYARAGARVHDYRRSFGIRGAGGLEAVIIQEQIQAEYAGVFFTAAPRPFQNHHALIEITRGSASEMLSGSGLGALFGVDTGPPDRRFSQLAGTPYEISQVYRVLAEVLETCEGVETAFNQPQDLEWVWDGANIYVVQARAAHMPLWLPGRSTNNKRSKSHRAKKLRLPLADRYGQKAAAETFFMRHGCGAPNAAVIQPGATPDEVEKRLGDRKGNDFRAGTTLRYSYQEQGGLPVAFVDTEGDVPTAYVKHRKDPAWAGIVSDYVFVEDSFEAVLTQERIVVEHVPGNWEPQSTMVPDVFEVTNGDAPMYWLFRSARMASFGLPGDDEVPMVLSREMPPVPIVAAMEWMDEAVQKLDLFRNKLRAYLPLNLHFVRSSDGLHFLNIRPATGLRVVHGDRSPRGEFRSNRHHVVASYADLLQWDRASVLLVSGGADTSGQASIAKIGIALREQNVRSVRTTFGALSHPALVLRECGIETYPMYVTHDCHKG